MFAPSQYLNECIQFGPFHNPTSAQAHPPASSIGDEAYNTHSKDPVLAVAPWNDLCATAFVPLELQPTSSNMMDGHFHLGTDAPEQSPLSSAGSMATPTSGPFSRRTLSSRTSAEASSNSSTQTKSRRKSSSANSTQADSGLTSGPKRNRTKKEKTVEIKEEDEDNYNEEDNDKRNKFLERNRVAASKCRQKKKEWVSDLEGTKQDLQSQNSRLQSEYTGLINEVNTMKTQLMSHACCNDPMIDKWIENEARKYVQATSERFDQMGVPHLPGRDLIPNTHNSRQSSISSPTNETMSPYSRRGSMGFTLTSPSFFHDRINSTITGEPSMPQFSVGVDGEGDCPEEMQFKDEVNFDHMPDNMFEAA